MQPRNDRESWLVLIVLVLIWGSSFILIKQGLKALSPYQIPGIRLGTAALVLSPFMFRYYRSVRREDWKWIFASGMIGTCMPAFLFAIAQTRIPSAQAGILNSLAPVFVLIMSRVLFGARFPGGKILGVLLGLSGAVLILSRKGDAFDFGENFQYGLIIVLATVFYGISTSLLKYRLSHTSPELVSSFASLFAAIPSLVVLFGFSGFGETLHGGEEVSTAILYVMVLGALSTGVALVLFNRLIKMRDVVFASSVTYLMPIVSLGWGLTSGEPVGVTQLLGLGLILGGVYLMNRQRN